MTTDTGVLNSDGVTTSYTYEFEIPVGMNVVLQSTSYISGFATYSVLYDNLPFENLVLPSDTPTVVNSQPGQVIDGKFYPFPSVVSKLDELIDINKQIASALLLLLNLTDNNGGYEPKDLAILH